MSNNVSNGVQRIWPFIKGVYTALRQMGYSMEEAMKIIEISAKVCAADEMTGGNEELKEDAK